MRSSNLFSLLRTFTIKELNSFGEYISQNSVNNRIAVTKLFAILKVHYPAFPETELDSHKIFSELFPGKRFNDSALRPLFHFLYEYALDFITIIEFKNGIHEFDHQRISALLSRKDYKATGRAIERAKKNLENGKLNAPQFYYHSHLLKDLKLIHSSFARDGIYQKFLPEIDLQDAFNDLSAFFALRTIQMYLNVLNVNAVYGTKLPVADFTRSIKAIDKKLIAEIPVVELYLSLTKLITDRNNKKHYVKIRKLLKKEIRNLNMSDLQEIYINLENYCNNRILAGDEFFQKEKFKIYKEEIETGVYMAGGSVSPIFFKSAVSLALRLSELDWAKQFMDSHKDQVDKKPTLKNAYHFSMASYEFAMKHFGASLEHLSLLEFDDAYMKVDSKILQMLNYYETGSTETLIHSLEAFRHFLKSDKSIPNSRKFNYLNFYRFFRKLISLKSDKDVFELRLLKKQVESEPRVSQKKWMLEKFKIEN